jgi:hypothetical protein
MRVAARVPLATDEFAGEAWGAPTPCLPSSLEFDVMPKSLPRPVSSIAAAMVAAGCLVPASAVKAQEAITLGDTPVSILLSAARAEYGRDELCIDPDDWLTTFRLSLERGAFGLSVASVAAYPWPIPPPDIRGQAFLDRGNALQVGLEVDPLRLLGAADGDIGGFLRPFVGGGVHLSTDGDAAGPGVNGPERTVAVEGGADPFVTYGARLSVPVGDGRFGVFGEVRGNSVFDGGKSLVDPSGERLESESGTLNWAEFSVGVRVSLR